MRLRLWHAEFAQRSHCDVREAQRFARLARTVLDETRVVDDAVVGQAPEEVAHRARRVEVALRQRVGAGRQRRVRVDATHLNHVVARVMRAEPCAAFAVDELDALCRFARREQPAEVGVVANLRHLDHRGVELHRGDLRSAVAERDHHVNAAADADHHHGQVLARRGAMRDVGRRRGRVIEEREAREIRRAFVHRRRRRAVLACGALVGVDVIHHAVVAAKRRRADHVRPDLHFCGSAVDAIDREPELLHHRRFLARRERHAPRGEARAERDRSHGREAKAKPRDHAHAHEVRARKAASSQQSKRTCEHDGRSAAKRLQRERSRARAERRADEVREVETIDVLDEPSEREPDAIATEQERHADHEIDQRQQQEVRLVLPDRKAVRLDQRRGEEGRDDADAIRETADRERPMRVALLLARAQRGQQAPRRAEPQ